MAEGEWAEIMALEDEWMRVFREAVPMGFEVTPDAAPILRECLAEKSQAKLDTYIALKMADGRVY